MFRKVRVMLLACAVLTLCTSVAVGYTGRQTWDLHRINTVRSQHGVEPALYLGAQMTRRAQAWADELASKNSQEVDDRPGASVCFKAGGHYYGANSAIAIGYPNDLATDQYGLEHSPPHLANILGRHFHWVGIGIASDRHGLIVVQDFCGR
jgi:uncharacterized protein YkwD